MIKQQTSDMPSVIAKAGKQRAFNNADLIGVTINGVAEIWIKMKILKKYKQKYILKII